jgi:hypothetical protein
VNEQERCFQCGAPNHTGACGGDLISDEDRVARANAAAMQAMVAASGGTLQLVEVPPRHAMTWPLAADQREREAARAAAARDLEEFAGPGVPLIGRRWLTDEQREESDDEFRARIMATPPEPAVYVANLDGMARGEPMRLTTDPIEVPAGTLGPYQAAYLDTSALTAAEASLEPGVSAAAVAEPEPAPAAPPIAPTKADIHDMLRRAGEPLSKTAEQIARPRLDLFPLASWNVRIWLKPHRTGKYLLIHARLQALLPAKAGEDPDGVTEEAHTRMAWETLASERGGELLAAAALELAGAVIGRTVTRLIDGGVKPREFPAGGDGKTCTKCGAANPMPMAIRWNCALCGEVNLGPIGAAR